MNVLFVCTGNICRSPMAEAMLRDALDRNGWDGVTVASAGTWAYSGLEATPEAVAVLDERGIDLRAHRSRALEEEHVAAADVVVVMTSVHEREVMSLAPSVVDKLVLAKELPGIETASRERDGDGVHALLSGSRPPRRRALDLDDPMGLPRSAYERCVRELEPAVELLASAISRDLEANRGPTGAGP